MLIRTVFDLCYHRCVKGGDNSNSHNITFDPKQRKAIVMLYVNTYLTLVPTISKTKDWISLSVIRFM